MSPVGALSFVPTLEAVVNVRYDGGTTDHVDMIDGCTNDGVPNVDLADSGKPCPFAY